MNIEYEEVFEKTIYKDALKNLVLELEEVYSTHHGWTVGTVYTKPVDSERIKVSVRLTKQRYDDEAYRETFTKVISKESLKSFMDTMYETYSEDLGWTVSEPLITDLGNNEIIVRVPLTKRSSELRM